MRLHKSTNNKMICGVCAGLAENLNIDVSIIRIIWAALAVCFGSGLLLYIIAAIVLPNGY